MWESWCVWALEGCEYSKSIKGFTHKSIKSMGGVPQNPQWHPEGDVLTHTGFVLDAMNEICIANNITYDDRIVLMMAALCHDMGKVTNTRETDGKITSYGHEAASVPIAYEFLKDIHCPEDLINRILPLVKNHMVASQKMSDKSIKRLKIRLGEKTTIKELCYLIEADQCGRPPLPKIKSDNLIHLIERFAELESSLQHEDKPKNEIEVKTIGKDVVLLLSAYGRIARKIELNVDQSLELVVNLQKSIDLLLGK